MKEMDIDLSRAAWRTSSFSGANGQCVQIAFVDGERVAVATARPLRDRHSFSPPMSGVPSRKAIKSGEFDL